MSGNITVCSIHRGPINVTRRNDKQEKLTLEPTGRIEGGREVFVAKVDEELAGILLDGIGRPHYWSPGAIELTSEDLKPGNPTAPAQPGGGEGGITVETYGEYGNHLKFVAAVNKCADPAVLKGLYDLEAGGENREKRLAVILARIDAVTGEEKTPDAEPAALTAETYGTLDGEELAAAIEACTDAALLMELIAAETQGENREERFGLLTARLEALQA